MLDTLTTLLQPWADLYAASTALSTAIIAAHVLAMFIGGGLALGADRQVIRQAGAGDAALRGMLEELQSTHGLVVGALAVTVATGLALVTSDLATFAVSPVYWAKMTTFVLLLGNGRAMQRAERRMHAAVAHGIESAAASRLVRSAWVSLAGWLTIVLLSVILTNV